MQVKSIAECSEGGGGHSAILLTFNKLQVFINIFVLSIFERPFYTGFTVIQSSADKALNCKPYIYLTQIFINAIYTIKLWNMHIK